jgi:Arc/MetJ-type ribon-helix-helix transcriptional regulator
MALPQRGGKPIAIKLSDEMRAQLDALVTAHPTYTTASQYVRGLIAGAYQAACDEYAKRTAVQTSTQPALSALRSALTTTPTPANPFASPSPVRAVTDE